MCYVCTVAGSKRTQVPFSQEDVNNAKWASFRSSCHFDKIGRNLVALSRLDDPLGIAAFLQREPAALLWVVRLCKILPEWNILTKGGVIDY